MYVFYIIYASNGKGATTVSTRS